MGKDRIVCRFGPFSLDRTARVLFCGSEPVPLAPRTVDTLVVLLEAEGRVLTKEELLQRIWPDRTVDEVNLTQQISLLRRALAAKDSATEYVRNFPGRGYQFVAAIQKPEATPEAAPAPPAPPRKRPVVPLLAAGAVLVAAAYWILRPGETAKPPAPMRRIALSRLPGSKSHPALSSDGARVAFVWNRADGSEPCIYVKAEGREVPQLLPGSCGNPSSPTWSPDGLRLAYLRNLPDRTELVVHTEFSQDRILATFFPLRSLIGNRLLAWSPDGKTIAACGKQEAERPLAVHLISADTGASRVLSHPAVHMIGDADPAFSPDGQRIAFTQMSSRFTMQLAVAPVSGGPSLRILGGDQLIGGVVWSPGGKEVIFSSNRSGGYRLWRIAADQENGTPQLDPAAIAGENPIHLSIAPAQQRLAYVVSGEDLNIWQLRLTKGKSAPEWKRVIASTGLDAAPQYSPDGSRVCFLSDRSGEEHIWVANADGSEPRQLTGPAMSPGHCAWSADGAAVMFVAHGGGFSGVHSIPAAGGAARQIPLEGGGSLPVASPDGQTVFSVRSVAGRYELFSANLAGGSSRQLTTQGAHRARVSHDGRWVYYVQARTSPSVWRIPTAGGAAERVFDGLIPGYFGSWALSSQGIYFLGEDPKTSRPVVFLLRNGARAPEAVAGFPSPLPPLGLAEFSVAPDGSTLLTVLRESSSSDLMALAGFR
ncbi:MAG: winged helix-turn-helix domain-containing protein [Bryobacter sp.]|nr:winged helix-turn-helix domain-containing protein [Bryobacter sp.]